MDTTPEQETAFYTWAKAQIGKPYDWKGILAFAFDETWRNGNSWFCSMFAYAATEHIGKPIIRIQDAGKVLPDDFYKSLILTPTTPW